MTNIEILNNIAVIAGEWRDLEQTSEELKSRCQFLESIRRPLKEKLSEFVDQLNENYDEYEEDDE